MQIWVTSSHPHADLAKSLELLARTKVLQLVELAYLDLGFLALPCGVGKAPGPLHRFLLRLHLDERVAGDQLLGLGERAVDDAALFSRVLDAPAFRARLEAGAV
jgi:hypothetical protein